MFCQMIVAVVVIFSFTGSFVSSNSVTNFCGDFDAQEFVDQLIESNVVLSVSNYNYTGACIASGLIAFDDDENYMAYTLGVGETALVLTSGNLSTAALSENRNDGISTDNGEPGDVDLQGLISELNGVNYTIYDTFDASIIEFDIVSSVSVYVSFEYIFASDEYNEYANSQFNDVFAFWLNEENVATINGTVVAINNVNSVDLPKYFISNDISTDATSYNNGSGTYEGLLATEYDGLTVLLSTSPYYVEANENVHVKLAIADTGDGVFDSAVYLKPKSFTIDGGDIYTTVGNVDSTTVGNVNATTIVAPTSGSDGGDSTAAANNETYFVIPTDDSDSGDSGVDIGTNSGNIRTVGILTGLVVGLASVILGH